MEGVRVYLDSNVFIRLFEGNDELAAGLARLFTIELRSDVAPPLATSELTLAELLVIPYRESNERLIEIYDRWTISNSYLEVGPIDRGVLWYAAVLRSQYRALKLPDAIHLSSAIGMKCSHFLTADAGFAQQYHLTHRRFGMTRGPVSIQIVRPEIASVEQLINEFERR
jgi:predicted nucleic acid-binding protein